MADAADFRRLVLALPDTVEGAHHGHADFRLHGRVFASLDAAEARGMVHLAPELQRALAAEDAAFVPANGAWGRQGCTMVQLADVALPRLRAAITAAWQRSLEAGAAKASPRPRQRPGTGGRRGKR
jgi:hypothetical protein